jgi:hypothetical protein
MESVQGAGVTIIDGGVVVAATAAGTVIGKLQKGFSIHSSGVGVFVDAAEVVVQDSIVTADIGVQGSGASSRLKVVGNLIEGGAAGVQVAGNASQVLRNAIVAWSGGIHVLATGDDSVLTDNVVTGSWAGVMVEGANVAIRRNTFTANGYGVVLWAGGAVVTFNNFIANDRIGSNCGLANSTRAEVSAPGNYWGSASGPGVDPGDVACGDPVVTTRFLRAPVIVNNTGGR